jgi:Family of unknown function (DUF6932)
MSIPAFDSASGNLPPGVHDATWAELESTFGWTPERERLLLGLRGALLALQAAGCRRAYVDGSFVTSKDVPGDFDGCWEPQGVDPDRLDPTLLDFSPGRAAQKAKYGGELFLAGDSATSVGARFLDFFQKDKTTGDPKGIIAIDLGGLS